MHRVCAHGCFLLSAAAVRALPHLHARLALAGPRSFQTPSPSPGASGPACCSQCEKGILGALPRPRLCSCWPLGTTLSPLLYR